MKRTSVDLYAAVGVISLVAMLYMVSLYPSMGLAQLDRQLVARARYMRALANAVHAQKLATCTPTLATTVSVGGLPVSGVPRLSNALRLNYDDSGVTQYVAPLGERDVLGYYLSTLTQGCWNVSAIVPHQVVMAKDSQAVKIAVAEDPLGGRSRVVYQGFSSVDSTRVLGFTLAQSETLPPPPSGTTTTPPPSDTSTTPPPPPPSDFSSTPPPTGTTPPPPPPGDQFGTPPPGGQYPSGQYPSGQSGPYPQPGQFEGKQYPQCGQDQYFCNDKCVPRGSACNGYNYPKPGEGQHQQGPTPQGSPFGQGQFPGKGEFKGRPGEFPGGPGGQQGFDEGQGRGEFGRGFGEGQGEHFQPQISEQQLEGMKRGLKQFVNGAGQMKRFIDRSKPRLQKCGVGIPTEITSALDRVATIKTSIEAAKTPEDMMTIGDDIMDVGQTMQEWGPRLGDLTRTCEMFSFVTRDITQLDRQVQRALSRAKSNPVLETPAQQMKTLVDGMKQALTEAKDLASKGEIEAAMDKVEAVNENREEIGALQGEIEMLANLKNGLAQARREITRTERVIATLAKRGVDAATITDLKEDIAAMKSKLTEIQNLSRQKGSAEAIHEAVSEGWDMMQEMQNKLDELGYGLYETNVKESQGVNVKIPDAFNLGAPTQQPPQEAPATF